MAENETSPVNEENKDGMENLKVLENYFASQILNPSLSTDL